MNNQNAQQQINIDLSTASSIECDECQHTEFVPAFIIKKVSALMSPTGAETMVPVQIFKCGKCNHINELFLQGVTN